MSTPRQDSPREFSSVQHAKELDLVCDAFEKAWLAGENPRIEDYLDQVDPSCRSQLLKELLLAEMDLQINNGIEPERDRYASRFPDHWDVIYQTIGPSDHDTSKKPSQLPQPPLSSGLRVRCPHCHNPINVAVESRLDEIQCSSCGSHFSLIEGSIATSASMTVKRLGHFELIEELGAGGFGSVWKARDTQLDRAVAVKIPRRGQLDPASVEQFLREARAAAQLNHPHIVSVHEVGRQEDTVYIVSDLVEGVSLSDWLKAERPTFREATQLCQKIANALQHAHQTGVIHRDLKPQNIMLDADGQPHLMDFGLARRSVGEVTMTIDGRVLGTPAYMSPEQARGEAHQADRRTDIYSLGVILFELLTGELPFRGNIRMLVHQVLHEEPPSPRKLNGNIPRDLETICLKCLEKDPEKRFDTARAVADEFDRYLRGQPIVARRITKAERAWRWCRRNPMAAMVVSLVAIIAVVGPIVAVIQTQLRLEAVRATAIANQQRLRADQRAYVSDMNLAAQAWEAGDLTRARDLLERHVPGNREPSSLAPASENDLRGFEWRLLWGLVNDDEGRISFEVPQVRCVALSPEGKHVACGDSDGNVSVFDLVTRQRQTPLRQYSSGISRIAYSDDGRWLATGCADGTILLWDVGSWREKAVLAGHTGDIRDLVFHPDGTQLTSIGTDKTIRIWSVTNSGAAQVIEHPEPDAVRISISADSATLATSGRLDNTVRFWKLRQDPAQRKYVKFRTLPPQQAIILSIALERDGKKAIISSHDSLVSSWDIETLKPLATYSLKVLCYDSVLSTDGQTLVTATSDNLVKLWHVKSGRELRTLSGPPHQIGLSADGKSLVTSVTPTR